LLSLIHSGNKFPVTASDTSEGEAQLNTCPAHLLSTQGNLTQYKLCTMVILPVYICV